MLANGHSRTWMISNTIVTITTSGTYIGLDGACDNCIALRERKASIILKEKATLEKSLKQRSTAADDSTDAPLAQAFSDRTQSQTTTDVPSKPENKFVSVDKTVLHKSQSVDTAKHKSMSEGRSSVASERRSSEPVVGVSPQNCQCVCQGWAEIFIRRPCGNLSWIMRIQNRETSPCLDSDVSMAVVDDPHIGECKLVSLPFIQCYMLLRLLFKAISLPFFLLLLLLPKLKYIV